LPVIAAAYELIPDHGDFLAKAEKLLRRYLWSAFFTDRYENTAASRAYADFKALKALLLRPDFYRQRADNGAGAEQGRVPARGRRLSDDRRLAQGGRH
jgi:hypothetical protein